MPNWRDALDSGVYTVQSVDHSAYATLKNDDDPTVVCSEVFATGQAKSRNRCWWRITKCDNDMYTIQNVHYQNHFIWRGGMDDTRQHNPLQATSNNIRDGDDDGIDDDIMWIFSHAPNGDFTIFSLDRRVCWQTSRSYHGKLQLGRYNASNLSSSQRWRLESVGHDSGASFSVRRVLSLDGCGIYGVAGLIVLQEVMKRLAAESEKTPTPCSVFNLVCGASSGGIIALLVGRFGLDCGDALVQYRALMERLPSVQGCNIGPRCEAYPRTVSQIFKQFFGREGHLMIPSMNNAQSKHTSTIVTTARLEVVPGTMPPQISGTPRTSCIRSYQPIDLTYNDMDDITTYTWPVEEVVIATCAPHPYCPPLQIRNNPQALTPTFCQDPSLHGSGNPINVAIREAERLFADQHVVFISVGAGMIDERTEGTRHRRPVDNGFAERAVMEAYQTVGAHRAEETDKSTRDAWSNSHHRLVRICPMFDPNTVDVQDHDSILNATQTWMRSPQGQAQIDKAVHALLGHADHPDSHGPSGAGRNTEDSAFRPPSAASFKSSQHEGGSPRQHNRTPHDRTSQPPHAPPRGGSRRAASPPPPYRDSNSSEHRRKQRRGHATRKSSPSPDKHHQRFPQERGSRSDGRSRAFDEVEGPPNSDYGSGGEGSNDDDNFNAPQPPSRRHPVTSFW